MQKAKNKKNKALKCSVQLVLEVSELKPQPGACLKLEMVSWEAATAGQTTDRGRKHSVLGPQMKQERESITTRAGFRNEESRTLALASSSPCSCRTGDESCRLRDDPISHHYHDHMSAGLTV